MTGEQFKYIRRSNRISQGDVARFLKKGDRNTVYRAELSPFVPIIYIKALSEALHYDLTKPTNLERLLADSGVEKEPPLSRVFDWNAVFVRPNTGFTFEEIHQRLVFLFQQRTQAQGNRGKFTRSETQNLLYHAVKKGDLRMITRGRGSVYLLGSPQTEEIQPEQPANSKKQPQNASKKPLFDEKEED